jgi:chromosome transmission fidelity protein 1
MEKQMSDFVSQLLMKKSQEEISMFSCGHIIPAANITTVAISKGPRGGAMQFNMSNQSNPEVVQVAFLLIFAAHNS